MHAARAMNAQRKRREERLQAQHQRSSSAVSGRSGSRSPVPSMDIEAGGKKRGKTKSKRVDLVYVGFILAIFGAVPLLVGTFISVPGLWETGLGLTLIGLLIGIFFWCCDFCVKQPPSTSHGPDANDRRSRPRRAHKGKVEDSSTRKSQESPFKNGSMTSFKDDQGSRIQKQRLTPTPSPARVKPTPSNSDLNPSNPDVYITRTETISEVQNVQLQKKYNPNNSENFVGIPGSVSSVSGSKLPSGVFFVGTNTSDPVPTENQITFRSVNIPSDDVIIPVETGVIEYQTQENSSNPETLGDPDVVLQDVNELPSQDIKNDEIEPQPSDPADESQNPNPKETNASSESDPAIAMSEGVSDQDLVDLEAENPMGTGENEDDLVDPEVESAMAAGDYDDDPVDLDKHPEPVEDLQPILDPELGDDPIEINQIDDILNDENIQPTTNVDENVDKISSPLNIEEAIAEITSSPDANDDKAKIINSNDNVIDDVDNNVEDIDNVVDDIENVDTTINDTLDDVMVVETSEVSNETSISLITNPSKLSKSDELIAERVKMIQNDQYSKVEPMESLLQDVEKT